MKLLSPGPWLDKGMMIQMSEAEYLEGKMTNMQGSEVLRLEGKTSTVHYLVVHGQPVTVYVVKKESERFMEAAAVG